MLILTRRPGESIHIGDNIKITILDGGRPNQVRVGIDAPKELYVHRAEIYQKIILERIEKLQKKEGRNESK